MSAAFPAVTELPIQRVLDRLAERLAFHRHDDGALASAINLELDRARRSLCADEASRRRIDSSIAYLEARKRALEARIRARLALSSNVVALRA